MSKHSKGNASNQISMPHEDDQKVPTTLKKVELNELLYFDGPWFEAFSSFNLMEDSTKVSSMSI